MLKWTLWIVLGLVALVAAIAVVGLTLPKSHHASTRAVLQSPPMTVYSTISDVAHAAVWRTDVKSIEILPEDGAGLRFRENGANGPITYRVVEAKPGERFVTRIEPGLAFGGTWTFVLKPSGAGTELTITEDGEVYNPIFRFVSTFFFSPTATMEAYIAALKKKLGS